MSLYFIFFIDPVWFQSWCNLVNILIWLINCLVLSDLRVIKIRHRFILIGLSFEISFLVLSVEWVEACFVACHLNKPCSLIRLLSITEEGFEKIFKGFDFIDVFSFILPALFSATIIIPLIKFISLLLSVILFSRGNTLTFFVFFIDKLFGVFYVFSEFYYWL